MVTYILVPGIAGSIVFLLTFPGFRALVPGLKLRKMLHSFFSTDADQDRRLLLRVRIVALAAVAFAILIFALRVSGYIIPN